MAVTVQGSYPTLRLEHVPLYRRLHAAIRFLPIAWASIQNRTLAPRYSFHIADGEGAALGVSSGDVQFPIGATDISTLERFVIALEDRRFHDHSGIDLRAIARAALANVKALRVVQGGGTLTQQLVRNTLLTPAPSLVRKLLEMVLALKLERHYSKSEILRRYCELVYLGGGVRGFAAAARGIYRRNLANLRENELCGVVGLLRSPGRTYPSRAHSRYFARQAFISGILRKDSSLKSPATVSAAPINPIRFSIVKRPRLTSIVRSQIQQRLGNEANLVTRATLSIDRTVQHALDGSAKHLSFDPNVKSVAGVVLDLATGRVLGEAAWANGREMEFSPTYFGRIQPGSTFKTFAVLTALQQGRSPNTVLESSPYESTQFRTAAQSPWRVRSFRDEYQGQLTLAEAFRLSDNTAFARLSETLDLESLYAVLEQFRLAQVRDLSPAVVLGALPGGINLLSLAAAYAAIARCGRYIAPTIVRGVRLADGRDQVLSDSIPILLPFEASHVAILKSLLVAAGKSFGNLTFSGKTGTTRTGHLFAGYNDQIAAAMWVGYRHRQSEHVRKGVGALDMMSGFISRLMGRSMFLGIG
jgi:membrane peptidoglycan carboxypeptidase